MSSLKRRIAFAVLLGQVILLAGGTVLAYRTGVDVLTRQFDEAVLAKAYAFRMLLEQQGEEVEFGWDERLMPEYGREESPEYFQVWLEDSELFRRSPSLNDLEPPQDLERRAGTLEAPETWDGELPNGESGRFLGVRMSVLEVEAEEDGGELPEPGAITLVLAKPRTDLDQLASLLLFGLLAGDVLLAVCGALLVVWAVGHSLAPVRKLAEQVAAVDVNTLAETFDPRGYPTELTPIVSGLDDLLRRLDHALRAERRTASNVAHELRTPIAELRALTEIGLRSDSDARYRARVVRQAHEIALELETLIALVRKLTMLDEHAGSLDVEPLEMEPIVMRAAAALADRLRERSREIGAEVRIEIDVAGAWMESHRDALSSICTNLLGNAVEYTTGGGIAVRALHGAGEVTLEVVNECEGLTPDHVAHLTEPFWRLSEARTRSGHHGLGLTIAQGMAALAGLELSFEVTGDRFVARATAAGRFREAARRRHGA